MTTPMQTARTEPEDGCLPEDHVWQVIEETPDGVVVECYDCGADGIVDAPAGGDPS